MVKDLWRSVVFIVGGLSLSCNHAAIRLQLDYIAIKWVCDTLGNYKPVSIQFGQELNGNLKNDYGTIARNTHKFLIVKDSSAPVSIELVQHKYDISMDGVLYLRSGGKGYTFLSWVKPLERGKPMFTMRDKVTNTCYEFELSSNRDSCVVRTMTDDIAADRLAVSWDQLVFGQHFRFIEVQPD